MCIKQIFMDNQEIFCGEEGSKSLLPFFSFGTTWPCTLYRYISSEFFQLGPSPIASFKKGPQTPKIHGIERKLSKIPSNTPLMLLGIEKMRKIWDLTYQS
jgi:hypothetical protein